MVIFLATSAHIQVPHPDDSLLIQALQRRGFEARLLTWGAVPHDAVVVIRTTWDYYLELPAFLTWIAELEHARCRLLNPPSTVRWNADKSYLLDLQDHGIPMLPTRRVDEHSALPDTPFVLKPMVSAGAYLTQHFATEEAARLHIQRIHTAGGHVLMQPFAQEVLEFGELSLIFFALPEPVFSHAVLKKPRVGDFRVQSEFGGENVRIFPEQTLISQAFRILETMNHPFVYARVDGIVRDGVLLLMEIELIEPELFTRYAQGSAERFAQAIVLAMARCPKD